MQDSFHQIQYRKEGAIRHRLQATDAPELVAPLINKKWWDSQAEIKRELDEIKQRQKR